MELRTVLGKESDFDMTSYKQMELAFKRTSIAA